MKCSSVISLVSFLGRHKLNYKTCHTVFGINSRALYLADHQYGIHRISESARSYYAHVPSSYLKNHQCHRTFSTAPALNAEMIDVTFVTNDGKKHKTKGKIGDNLLDVVVNNSIDLDGFGACEGTLACSTCHLVFKKPDFDKITDKITDEELDMLDLAYGLTDTSRLGCQVTLTKALDGVEVQVPAGVNDQRG